MLQDTRKFLWTLLVKNFRISLNITGYMEISMDALSKNIFELVSMLEGTWKFPWTLSVKHFLIILVSMLH